jgi:glycerate 2-kinase
VDQDAVIQRPIRILICPDKFKGSATAASVCESVTSGLVDELDTLVDVRSIPLADGGDGTLDVLAATPGARVFVERVSGPLGDPVDAEWALLADGTAVVEMARASGLALVTGPLQPIRASTHGTGQLIRAAIDHGAARIVVGVGGSATTDGGVGALDALGWTLGGVDVTVATDVTTTFVDAARVFGPQKGATSDDVVLLTERLQAVADRFRTELGVDVAGMMRSGAAGGLAGGLAALGARLVSGFDMVAGVVELDRHLDWADVVITGEGRFDSTSFVGKPVGEVLPRARARSLPVLVVCGVSDPEVHDSVDAVVRLVDRSPTPDDAISNPRPFIRASAQELARWITSWAAGRHLPGLKSGDESDPR